MRMSLLLLVVLVGCARKPHTNPEFGVNVHSAFDRQARATERGSAQGLDSEEAASIQRKYRQSLGSGSTSQQRNDPHSSVLILEDGNATTKKQ